jgi:hypothetical protein
MLAPARIPPPRYRATAASRILSLRIRPFEYWIAMSGPPINLVLKLFAGKFDCSFFRGVYPGTGSAR